MPKSPKVILVGAGPGDPELITVRGMKAIQQADTIVYDYLANAILLEHAKPGVESLYVGKKAGAHSKTQDEINELLVVKAQLGKTVVRLKGGDPYVFGRGGEEVSFLQQHGIDFEVVPGVPAACGMSAYTGIPLTDRRCTSIATLVTGHSDPTLPENRPRWEHLAKTTGTLVIYMGIRNLTKIVQVLLESGMAADMPVSLVEWATTPQQRTVSATLSQIVATATEQNVRPPALIVIGKVNELREELWWLEKRPLHNRRIVVTRSRAQSSTVVRQLRELGADVIEMPVIACAAVEDTDKLDHAISKLTTYDWVIFTSINGVEFFMKRLFERGFDTRSLAGIKISAVGSATERALLDYGLTSDFRPSRFTGRSIFAELSTLEQLSGQRILLPRADIANPDLRLLCEEVGAEVDDIPTYRTVPGNFDADRLRQLISDGLVDAVTFTSSSTVRYFVDGLGGDFVRANKGKLRGFSIGPVTTGTMQEQGVPLVSEAEQHDIPGLLDALIQQLSEPNA